jgi:hypothetical protein
VKPVPRGCQGFHFKEILLSFLGIFRTDRRRRGGSKMAKAQDVKKDVKKKAQKTLKEKRAEKKSKKNKS